MDRDEPGRRERRDGWAAACDVEVTERDAAILYAVGRCRVLRTRDIARLFFGSRATANDRLRKLFVAGYVRCHVRALAGDNLYTLIEKGKQLVLAREDVEPRELPIPRALPARLDHLLGINEMRVLFTLATRGESAQFRLVSFRPEWELAAERHAGLLGVLPDGIIELEDARGARHVSALEVDLGTEAPTVVAKKVARYETYARAGLPLYGVDIRTVLVAARGERRVRSLARAFVGVANAVTVRLGDALALSPSDLFAAFRRAGSLAAGSAATRSSSHG
ncbi:MAG: replication-relaxation family protein [Deltaproteobacteria bacterium]|nr:replication-relaxation family protein [Deltaproteobacteria bacterium]